MDGKNTLYKYLSSNRTSILEDGLIRFTQPGDLNDVNECRGIQPVYDIDEFVNRIAKKYMLDNGFLFSPDELAVRVLLTKQKFAAYPSRLSDRFMSRMIEIANTRVGVLSLSKLFDESLMWAHYSENHRGYCIGLDSSNDFFTHKEGEPEDIGVLKEVEYRCSKVYFNVDADIEDCAKLFYLKSDAWKYEKEVRIVRQLRDADESLKGNGRFPIHLFRLPLESIQELIAGVAAEPGLVNTLRSYAKSLHIPLYRMKIEGDSYSMRRERIL